MNIDGIVIKGYRDPQQVGRGVSSVVYRATQESTGAERAIKVIVGASADFRRQFLREKEALASLHHANIVSIIDAGTAETKEPYLVTDFYPDGSLDDRLQQTPMPTFSPSEVCRIGIEIAGALDAAHDGGWVHRDIKPANILLRGKHVALADFGIARDAEVLGHTGSLDWSTPLHAAPETMCGDEDGIVQPPTPSSDVYSLASTLYTLLAGRPPFIGPRGSSDSMPVFLGRLCDQPVRTIDRSDLTDSWDAFFRKALAKHPEDRFATATDLAEALTGLAKSPKANRPADRVDDIDDVQDLGGTIDRSATPRNYAGPNATTQTDGKHSQGKPEAEPIDPDFGQTLHRGFPEADADADAETRQIDEPNRHCCIERCRRRSNTRWAESRDTRRLKMRRRRPVRPSPGRRPERDPVVVAANATVPTATVLPASPAVDRTEVSHSQNAANTMASARGVICSQDTNGWYSPSRSAPHK